MRSIQSPVFSIILGSLLFCLATRPLANSQVSVLTQRYDLARDGLNTNETILTLSSVNSSNFGKLFSFPVDGYLFAQPLYVPNITIPGNGTHNVVFAATMHDSVYAFDADGLLLQPLWQAKLAALGCPQGFTCTSVPTRNDFVSSTDILPEIGILSTPVIDPTTNTLYVVAKTQETSGSTTIYVYRLHALDITTGAERSGSPVVIQGQVPGTGTPNSGGFLVFSPQYSLQRPGLALVNNNVYAGFGSSGDDATWHGWIFGYSKSSLSQTAAIASVPNGSEGHGGIWMHGNGLAADASGNLYFSTGNGGFDGSTNFGDSYLKLSTPGLTIADYFTPYNQQDLDTNDKDVAAGGLTLLPDSAGTTQHPHIMIGCGKNGAIYVIDRDNLGQFNSANDNQIIQELLNVIGSAGFDVCYSSPTYWQGHVYIGGIDDSLKMFDFSNGLLSTSAASQSSTTYQYPGTSPVLSANGSSNGIVWAIENAGSLGPDITGTSAVLHAYDAANLSNELYNSAQVASDAAGAPVKFTVPTIANGKVYIGTQPAIVAYGLFSSMPQAATPTFSPVPGTYGSAVSVTISDSTAGAAIYYTADGSTPTSSSKLYVGPILVSSNTVIKAMAVAPGYRDSQITTGTYIIGSGGIMLDSSSLGQGVLAASSLSWSHTVGSGSNRVLVVGVVGGCTPSVNYGGVALTQVSQVLNNNSAGNLTDLFVLVAPATGTNTVQVSYSGCTSDVEAGSISFTGVNQSTPLAHVTTNFGSGTNPGVTVTSASGDMVVDVVGNGSAITSSSQSLRWVKNQNGNTAHGNGAQSTAAGAASVTMGYSVTADWWGIIGADVVAATSSTAPAAPTNVVATGGNGQVALSWSASSGATSYNVKRATTSGGPYTTIASPTTTSYTDISVTNGATYYYVVSAVNTAGESGNSSEVSATPQLAVPAAPTNLVATAGNGQVALSWSASSGATSYNVKRSTTSGGPYTTIASPSTTSYTNSGLTNGTTYYYVVAAVNTAGTSANSSQVSATPQVAVPSVV